MGAREYTEDERRDMLRAIDERRGKWVDLDPDSEIAAIGSRRGLDKDQSYGLFKQLVDEGYVDPGRIFGSGGAMPGRTSRVVGRGTNMRAIGDDVRLTGKGQAEIE